MVQFYLIGIALPATLLLAGLVVVAVYRETRLASRPPVPPTADVPVPFGSGMAWIAIRTRDTERVLKVLGLTDVRSANWRSGVSALHDLKHSGTHVFVSPPVSGWTIVAGLALPHPAGSRFIDKCSPLLGSLGRTFIELQAYYCHPELDYYGWVRILDGRLVRGFAAGDEGIIWNKGRLTKEERLAGLKLFELRGIGRGEEAAGGPALYPTQEQLLRLASKWSLDPSTLDRLKSDPGVGHLGRAPDAWRPERTLHRRRARSAANDTRPTPPPA